MALEFNCPHCGVFYRLDDKLAGRMGKCKNATCQKSILIPFQSTPTATATKENVPTPAKPVDAESLAQKAFADEPPPAAAKETGPVKKIAVTCQFCEHKFEADAGLAGKNTPCPECGKIIRVPKPVEDKPIDWRAAGAGKPSLAKSDEPAPAGAWDASRKGVSVEALKKAGALESDDEEEPGERRRRRIKQALYGGAILGIVAFTVLSVMRMRRDGKQEQWMEKAVKEVEVVKKPELQAVVHRYAGEYYVRNAKKSEDRDAAMDWFRKSLDRLQSQSSSDADRYAMLIELGVSQVACGGDGAEVSEERRLPWEKVHPWIRKCFDKIPPTETELRARSMRNLTRKLAEKNQALLAVKVAQHCADVSEQPELIGRIGVELFLMGKKDEAGQVLKQCSAGNQPAAAALWLGLSPGSDNIPHLPLDKGKAAGRTSRLGYAEGRALQGRWDDARSIANDLPGGTPSDRVEALLAIAVVALETGNSEKASNIVESLPALLKAAPMPPWLLARGAELAARAGKPEITRAFIDAIKDDAIRSWAKLDVLRVKLGSQPKEKADESLLETVSDPEQATVAQALMLAEIARHNAAAGENSYTKTVETLPSALRPFGYAGTALGGQDRNLK